MRTNSVASYTFHNSLAYYYGIAADSSNSRRTTPYNMIDGETNVEDVQEHSDWTGRAEKRTYFKGGQYYKNIVNYIQEGGYITGMTSSDCATSPLSQDDGDYNQWIQ